MSKLRFLLVNLDCRHPKFCSLVRAVGLVILMTVGGGFAGYYINDLKNDIDLNRLEGAYHDAMIERDARLNVLENFCRARP